MKPLDRPLLADENISPEVIRELRAQGRDICSVHDEGLTGAIDLTILQRAHKQGRVVLTHDSDFGTLAIHGGQPYVGIVYLRPGHISWPFVLEMLAAIDSTIDTVEEPFILVAERRSDSIRIRVRSAITAY